MKKQWRIAVAFDTKRIFLGGHGTHLAFVGLPGVEHVALADSNPDGLDERMRQLGVNRPKKHKKTVKTGQTKKKKWRKSRKTHVAPNPQHNNPE